MSLHLRGERWPFVYLHVYADVTIARDREFGTAAGFNPSWSPDGRRIAYVDFLPWE